MRSATCLQTLHILLSFALKAARKALFRCVINSSTSRKPKNLLHSITMSLELVLKIFIRTLVTVNSSDLTSVRFTGHASSAYNKGKQCKTLLIHHFVNSLGHSPSWDENSFLTETVFEDIITKHLLINQSITQSELS